MLGQTLKWVAVAVMLFIYTGSGSSLYAQARTFQLPAGITSRDYLPGEIVLKVRSHSPSAARTARYSSGVVDRIQKLAAANHITPVVRSAGKSNPGARQQVAEQIYRLHTEQDVVGTINQLLQLEEVVYAEPYYLLHPLGEYIPDDPEAAATGQQDYLAAVQAYEAWAIEQGNPDILIGYLDTGVEFGHQDLTTHLYRNEADPINGIDDDGDGYTDNYVGWDFANQDNDPTADYSDHGTMVAGIGSASPDNGIGIAGLGFRSSYLPIKIFRSEDNLFFFGYEAIAYAADRGCTVINLSWGGANAYSQFGQDMINYAVLEKDAVVVAAAGNSGKQENYYPASYDNVLSVAVSDTEGNKVGQTTRSYWVDLLAPGNSSYTTKNGDRYGRGAGSSLSAPLVSGAAALIRARYPDLSARQVMEVLRLSAKDVYHQTRNQDYQETLGRGLLQVAQALKLPRTPALRMTAFSYRNLLGEYAYAGDTVTIHVDIQNFLSPASANTRLSLSAASEYVTVLDSGFSPGAIDSLATVSNISRPFRIVLGKDLPTNEPLVFRLGMEDGTYQDYQYFQITSSPDCLTLRKNELSTLIGSNGAIGYDPHGWITGTVQYQEQTLAAKAGLLIGVDGNHISDNLVYNFETLSREQDFTKEQGISIRTATVPAYQLRSSFTDQNATDPLKVRVEQTWLVDTLSAKNYLVAEYRLSNRLDSTLSDVVIGLFSDWNLSNPRENRTGWDSETKLGYTYDTDQQIYAGFALLTDHSVGYRALNMMTGNGNTSDISGNITDQDKYEWASQGVYSSEAGTQGSGNDVAQVLSATIDRLPPGKGEAVSFVWVVGNSLVELRSAVEQARVLYEAYREAPEPLTRVYFCPDSSATIRLSETYRFYEDARGVNFIGESNELTTSAIAQDTTLYAAALTDGYENRIEEIAIRMLEPIALFSVDSVSNTGWHQDTLFLDDTENTLLTFHDKSSDAVAWWWDFGNGYRSTQQHPHTYFNQPGTYTVQLTVSSESGCRTTITKELTVVQRASLPLLEERLICGGESVILSATNTEQLRVYQDEGLSNLLFEGSRYETAPIDSSTTYYAVNSEGGIDSRPVPVRVTVWEPDHRIAYALDTTDMSAKYIFRVGLEGNEGSISGYEWFVNGEAVSQQPNFVYDFSEVDREDWQLKLIYSIDSGGPQCTYSLEETMLRTPSRKPDLSALRVCRGEVVTIAPANGELFYFYKNADLATPFHKGKELELDSVGVNTTVYVTGVDGLVESEAALVEIEINRFADFRMLSDTVYLSDPSSAVFQAYQLDESEELSVSWQWDLGDGRFAHRSARISPEFDTAGVYSVRVLATREDGCTNLISKTVVVRQVMSTPENFEDQALSIYPNPARDVFYLQNLMWYQKDITISLMSTEGHTLIHQKLFYDEFPLPIDLSSSSAGLNPGMYLLRIQRDNKVFVRKLMIE